jgi:hypothetical protein
MAPVPRCCGPVPGANRRIADIEAERAEARLVREQIVADWCGAAFMAACLAASIALEVTR